MPSLTGSRERSIVMEAPTPSDPRASRQLEFLLPALDFAHNSSWHSSIDMAPLKTAQETQEDARNAATAAQERQKEQANRKRRPTDFAIGPFVILEERGHSYALQLPESYKMKNLFHADRLRKAADNPCPSRSSHLRHPRRSTVNLEWRLIKSSSLE
ncbi:his(2)-Cys(2) zinc finger domain-containing protein [Hirsutella rhossiliensis]